MENNRNAISPPSHQNIFSLSYLKTFMLLLYFVREGNDGFTSELIFYAWKQMSPESEREAHYNWKRQKVPESQ